LEGLGDEVGIFDVAAGDLGSPAGMLLQPACISADDTTLPDAPMTT